MRSMRTPIILAFIFFTDSAPLSADEIRIAVASNFAETMRDIAGAFEEQTGHDLVVASGSTGKHYAQIVNGAPFDAFFAADAARPERLEAEGLAIRGSRFTYAVGKLILWSPRPGWVNNNSDILSSDRFRYLAIANPKLAPYGKAAQQILVELGLWQPLQGRMVRGENIGQTFQFVHSGNAELGFVAYSQIRRPGQAVPGSFWLPPESLYDPIEQQAVLLKDSRAARAFLDFVKSDAREIVQGYGYATK